MTSQEKVQILIEAQDRATPVLRGISASASRFTSALNTAMTLGGVTAAIGAAGVAINKALDFGAAGAALINLEQGFEQFAARAGESADTVLRHMTDMSKGMMSQADLMQQYNKTFLLMGEEMASELPRMLQLAMASSAAGMGDLNYLMNSLTIGIGRLSPLILDNLGFTLKLGEAYEDYAQQIGKSASQLSKAEQQQAVLNNIMAQAEAKYGDLGRAASQMAGQGITRLRTATKDYIDYLRQEATPSIDKAADAIANMFVLPLIPGTEQYAQKQVDALTAALNFGTDISNPLSPFKEIWDVITNGSVDAEQAVLDLAATMDLAAISTEQWASVTAQASTKSADLSKSLNELRQSQYHARNEQEYMINTAQRLMGGLSGIGSTARGAAMGVGELTQAMKNLSMASDISAAISAVDAARKESDARARWRREIDRTSAFDPQMAEQLQNAGWYAFIIDNQEEYNRQIITGTSLSTNYWDTHQQGLAAATGGYGDLQGAMESYYDSWASQAAGILSPTQDFDLNALTEEVYGYQDKWDEKARRAMDVVKQGTDSPWAAEMGLGGKEDALQYIRDFYAGKLPDDVNWDSAIGQYQMQMEQQLGSQNLAAMFQEKLLGSGWGPEGDALATLQSSFGPGGENAAASFADSFVEHDWDGMSMTASERIMAGLTTHLEQRQGRYSDTFERFIVATVERVFFGGARP